MIFDDRWRLWRRKSFLLKIMFHLPEDYSANLTLSTFYFPPKQLSRSGKDHVFLRQIDLKSEGMYRCEVSAEAPGMQIERFSWFSVFNHGLLIIIVRIAINRHRNHLKLSLITEFKTAELEKEMKVFCECSSLSSSNSIEIIRTVKGCFSIRTFELIEKNVLSTVLPTEGPRITGSKAKYQVGDDVKINCTSALSKPAANLKWFVSIYGLWFWLHWLCEQCSN